MSAELISNHRFHVPLSGENLFVLVLELLEGAFQPREASLGVLEGGILLAYQVINKLCTGFKKAFVGLQNENAEPVADIVPKFIKIMSLTLPFHPLRPLQSKPRRGALASSLSLSC